MRPNKLKFFIARHNKFSQPRMLPFSLPHLIENEKYVLTHFYTTNLKMKLRSGKET
jgi:hypothetical protein